MTISSTLRSTCAARPGLCWKLPSISAKSCDQALSSSWSAVGTPSISAVTIAGSGLASSAMTSKLAARRRASSTSVSVISRMCSRSRATRRGVKAAAASRRTRPCSGGSRNSICRTMTAAIGAELAHARAPSSRSGVGVRAARKRCSTVITSAIAGDHPGVQVRIPVDRILLAQPAIQRIGVGQDLGVEQVVEAERRRLPSATGAPLTGSTSVGRRLALAIDLAGDLGRASGGRTGSAG